MGLSIPPWNSSKRSWSDLGRCLTLPSLLRGEDCFFKRSTSVTAISRLTNGVSIGALNDIHALGSIDSSGSNSVDCLTMFLLRDCSARGVQILYFACKDGDGKTWDKFSMGCSGDLEKVESIFTLISKDTELDNFARWSPLPDIWGSGIIIYVYLHIYYTVHTW